MIVFFYYESYKPNKEANIMDPLNPETFSKCGRFKQDQIFTNCMNE